MGLSPEELSIVNALLSREYTTSAELSHLTGIRQRVLKERIGKLKAAVIEYGYILEGKAGKGYSLIPQPDAVPFTGQGGAAGELPQTPEQRMYYILRDLIFSAGYRKLERYSEELYISRSSVVNIVRRLREAARQAGLEIKSRPKYGITLEGGELAVVSFAAKILYSDYVQWMGNGTLDRYLESRFGIGYEAAAGALSAALRDGGIAMEQAFIDDIILFVCTVRRRYAAGIVFSGGYPHEHFERSDYSAALNICRSLGLMGNDELARTLATRIYCMKLHSSNRRNKLSRRIAAKVVGEIEARTLIQLDKGAEYFMQLAGMLDKTVSRLKNGIEVPNPLSDTIGHVYLMSEEHAGIAMEVLEEETGLSPTDEERGYYTLFFHMVFASELISRKKALIINHVGKSVGLVIKRRLQDHCAGYFDEIDVADNIHELSADRLEPYDMAVSTVPLSPALAVPYVLVSPYMTEKDIAAVNEFLKTSLGRKDIQLYFHPRFFLGGAAFSGIDDIAGSIISRVKEANPGIDEKRLLRDIAGEGGSDSVLRPGRNIAFIRLDYNLIESTLVFPVVPNEAVDWKGSPVRMVIVYASGWNNAGEEGIIRQFIEWLDEQDKIVHDIVCEPTYGNFIRQAGKFKNKLN